MDPNRFGRCLTMTTFGESHGPALGVVIDGVPPGMKLPMDVLQRAMDRRRPGQSAISSPRQEADRVEVLSGLHLGVTTGTPLALLIRNQDVDSEPYEELADLFRPGHADYTYQVKYGIRDPRGGGRSSGRETAARVAAGAVAGLILETAGVSVLGWVTQIGDVEARRFDASTIESNPVRCPDPEAAAAMTGAIEEARQQGDSLGGRVRVIAEGVPAGIGDPVFGKLEASLAAALMSIGGVRGVEIGDGFAVARMRGSECNDPLEPGGFSSNHAGGINGGISNGEPIVLTLAVRPTPSIGRPQQTVDRLGRPRTLEVRGRHDPCICPRLVPVAEAMVSFCLADALLAQRLLGRPAPGGSKKWPV